MYVSKIKYNMKKKKKTITARPQVVGLGHTKNYLTLKHFLIKIIVQSNLKINEELCVHKK